ncbi:MAG: hypothetical protein ABW123_10435, partial [Cystobacter sp.]
ADAKQAHQRQHRCQRNSFHEDKYFHVTRGAKKDKQAMCERPDAIRASTCVEVMTDHCVVLVIFSMRLYVTRFSLRVT